MSWSSTPNLTDFLSFIRNVMGILPIYLPDNSVNITYAYDIAIDIVNPSLAVAPGNIYALAVYNLGGDNLVNFAPDQQNQNYFANLRTQLGINTWVPGVIQSSADQSTSESMLTPDFMKGFTLSDLQNLKTPWGRQYLAFAQRYGTLWGLT